MNQGRSRISSEVKRCHREALIAEHLDAKRRRELAEMMLDFIKHADAVELGVLSDALSHWSSNYPLADHKEELVIGMSVQTALERYYREIAA